MANANSKHLPEIFKVRYSLVNSHPYYSTLVFSMIPIDVGDKIPTIAVDKHLRLYFNPKIFNHDIDELKGILVHELKHVIMDTFFAVEAKINSKQILQGI